MFNITVLAIGKIKDASLRALASDYEKRLRPYAKLQIVELEPESFSSSNHTRAKAKEEERIRAYLKRYPEVETYLLAERGQEFDSRAFADFIDINQPLILVLAGALGFSDEMYALYPHLSLSRLTMPHELARVVLLEQVYRAATILKNKHYHY